MELAQKVSATLKQQQLCSNVKIVTNASTELQKKARKKLKEKVKNFLNKLKRKKSKCNNSQTWGDVLLMAETSHELLPAMDRKIKELLQPFVDQRLTSFAPIEIINEPKNHE
jgi:DNA-binding transcriptional regulator GbsR (MarR family)